MKATDVQVGDWVEVMNPWGGDFAKVREIRNGTAIIGGARIRVTIPPGADDIDCRKLDADEVAALGLE